MKRLHTLALHSDSTEVAFLYGRLHAQEEDRAEQQMQRHFDTAWHAAGHKKLHWGLHDTRSSSHSVVSAYREGSGLPAEGQQHLRRERRGHPRGAMS